MPPLGKVQCGKPTRDPPIGILFLLFVFGYGSLLGPQAFSHLVEVRLLSTCHNVAAPC